MKEKRGKSRNEVPNELKCRIDWRDFESNLMSAECVLPIMHLEESLICLLDTQKDLERFS